ncbi:hypothetical protein DERA104750_06330 [Deinococcus radiodurans]|nr:hypothetical protein DRO_0538 [Deinococcus radiodurans R1 = ATCC 13939 = DSM 20539]
MLSSTVQAQDVRGKTELMRSSLKPGVDRLLSSVNEAVTAAGGDLDKQNVHWVMAFSTGHFKSDPLGAQAAREVASQFIAREAMTGDQVTARAWELKPWAFRNAQGLTQQIGTDSQADKGGVERLWPTTPAVGSAGGHDTERAAVSFTKEFANSPDTVLILLTNTAASVGSAGTKLLGTNAGSYQKMLETWTRVAGTQDGATLNIPYTIKTPGGAVPGQMQAVVLLPKTFTATPLGNTTRTQQLDQSAQPVKAEKKNGSAAPFLLGLLGLGLIGGLVWMLIKGGGQGGARGSLRVGDSNFSLRDMPNGRPFCVIAGPGYSEEGVAVVPVQGLPAERIAELVRVGKDLKVRGTSEAVTLSSVDGRVAVGNAASFPLRLDQPDHQLELTGEVRGAGGVPREITRSLTLSYQQGDH